MPNNGSAPLWVKVITWVARIICGGLFIFSGFVKAIDPWGTIFKVSDYLGVLAIDIPFPLIRLGIFFLCAVEFIVGIFLFLGCFRKSCPYFAIILMLFFLPFSLWIAIENPVAECGCFGDALIISNWATFWKNILLTAGIVWLIFRNLTCICLITPAFQWLGVVSSGIFILVIELIGYYYQPLIDFRDYPIGTHLLAQYDILDNEGDDYLFLYEKEGKIQEFDLESLPGEDSGWEFIGRKQKFNENKSDKKSDKGIHVFDVESGDDMTEDLASHKGKQLIVMIPEVSEVSPATTWKLNSLYEWSEANDIEMVGIVAGNIDDIDNWEDLSMASYPIYLEDDTAIKEAVRGNPGIIYLDNGVIIWKSSLSSIDVDDFLSPEVSGDASAFGRDNAEILRNIFLIYLIFIGFLVLISFTPRMAQFLINSGLASRRGVRHH